MPKRTGTRSRKDGVAVAAPCVAKYAPTANTSSYTPGANSSPASSGASVRPSALVRTVFSRRRSPAGSSTQSSMSMPDAGRPCAVSRTCVVRRPGIVLILAGQGQADGAIRRARVAVDFDALVGLRYGHGIPEAVLRLEGDLGQLREAGQDALPHLVDQVLDRLAHEIVEHIADHIAHLGGGDVATQVGRDQIGHIAVLPEDIQVDEQR